MDLILMGLLTLMQSTPPMAKNPSEVSFVCPDHAQDSGHEVDIINAGGVVIQTIQGGDPPADANGIVTIPLNLQPVAFGAYTIRVRATASLVKSTDSDASNIWERVPGAPSKPVVK